MAHEKHIVDRLSTRLPSLLPEYIRDEAPVFELFLQSYFEYLESEILVLTSKGELTGIRLEDGTSQEASKILIETGTDSSSPDILTSKLIQEGEVEPFQVGEYIYGKKSGSVAKIKVINGLILIIDTISGTGFSETETIEGRDGKQSGVVKSYKENSVVANNRLLDYSDIDQTLETFLQYFQKDFIPSLDLKETQNARLTLKNIGTLYKQKGTVDSVKFLMRLLYGEDAEISYPIDSTAFASDSGYNEERRVAVAMDVGGTPKSNDKIYQYDVDDNTLVTAEAIIEQAYVIDSVNREYSCSISREHRGTFVFNRPVTLIDRDGVTTYTGTLKGIVSSVDNSNGSIYFELEDNSGEILDEDGNGLLHEETSSGSMYSPQDFINFTGSKTDTDTNRAKSNVTGLSKGSIEKIYIEESGQNFTAGDILVFDDTGTSGNGAEAVIGAVGDEIILEDAIAFEQYEITATSGQTVFGGIVNDKAVLDDHGKPISINRANLEVHIDGVPQNRSTFTFKTDGITFTTNPNLTGGERIEIFTDKSRLLYEDGEEMLLNAYYTDGGSLVSTDARLRRAQITSGGTGYELLPSVFPGGYLYFKDITGYQEGETVTGATSNATGTVLRLEPKNNRLVIKRARADTGIFVTGENILGGNSTTLLTCTTAKVSHGTGAKLYTWSSQIGAIEKLTINDQGSKFDSDAILEESTSYHNMLIASPSGTLNKDVVLTGSMSGATAQVQSFDNIRNILKYTNLSGMFINDEVVNYESTDTFIILKNDPYTARGKVSGEGIINDGFLSDKGYLSSEQSFLYDSKFYQSHSYVIKVGESINKYRSIVKDLVHPSGHIFFGEVAIKSQILGSSKDGIKDIPFDINENNKMGIISSTFVPTIVIQAYPTDNMLMEESTLNIPVRLLTEDNHLLENEESRDNKAHGSKETLILFHTTATEVSNQLMITQYVEAAGLNASTNGLSVHNGEIKGAGHLNILNRKEFITTATDTKIDNDPSTVVASRRPDITSFDTFIQKSPRRDGVVTVLNLETADHDYYVNNSDVPLTSEFGNVAIRPADSGKVFQFWHPSEEILILEDGTKILNEEPLNYARFEPFDRDFYGEKILTEDGLGSFLLEDDTVPETREYFVTERSIELDNPYMYMEDNSRIVFEDDVVLIDEESGENVHTFIPLGPTLRTINKIAFQQCYKISHYILDETSSVNEEDKILMEDGISGLLSETSEKEGLTIKQMTDMTGLLYLKDVDDKRRRRTNIAFSSYVNSSNITNSTLEVL